MEGGQEEYILVWEEDDDSVLIELVEKLLVSCFNIH